MNPIWLLHMFQLGCFNHQLGEIFEGFLKWKRPPHHKSKHLFFVLHHGSLETLTIHYQLILQQMFEKQFSTCYAKKLFKGDELIISPCLMVIFHDPFNGFVVTSKFPPGLGLGESTMDSPCRRPLHWTGRVLWPCFNACRTVKKWWCLGREKRNERKRKKKSLLVGWVI